MKILAAGDIHGDVGLAKKLAEKAHRNKVDLVVLCGDIVESEENIERIIGQFAKAGQKVLMVPGNHESVATIDTLAQLYGQVNLHGYSIKYKGVGLFGCSGVNIGPHEMPEEDIFKMLKQGFTYVRDAKKKVMVTHVHPQDTIMERFSQFVKGSSGIRKAITEFTPDILLCSHVHEAEGIEEKIGKTKVINVGREGRIITI